MRNKVWLLLVVVSVLLAAYVVRRVSTPSPVSSGEGPQSAAVPPPEPQPVAATSSPAATTGAGPVEQAESSRGSAPTVAAILADTDNRFRALVGDALVSEGSTVRGYRVRKVHADRVEFERDGRTWVQKLD